MKEIRVNNEGLTEVPSWLRHCLEIKKFTAAYNKIKCVGREELPPSLAEV
jgi:hypothetical protein